MNTKLALTGREQRLFDLLRTAIEAERESQKLYQEASGLTDDPMFRLVLNHFYQDEVKHEKEVIARYQQFRSTLKP
ncbi:MAG: hypothetical protein P8Z49_07615 [Acidobacteriota bacterium]|jgi:rubrerythrin